MFAIVPWLCERVKDVNVSLPRGMVWGNGVTLVMSFWLIIAATCNSGDGAGAVGTASGMKERGENEVPYVNLCVSALLQYAVCVWIWAMAPTEELHVLYETVVIGASMVYMGVFGSFIVFRYRFGAMKREWVSVADPTSDMGLVADVEAAIASLAAKADGEVRSGAACVVAAGLGSMRVGWSGKALTMTESKKFFEVLTSATEEHVAEKLLVALPNQFVMLSEREMSTLRSSGSRAVLEVDEAVLQELLAAENEEAEAEAEEDDLADGGGVAMSAVDVMQVSASQPSCVFNMSALQMRHASETTHQCLPRLFKVLCISPTHHCSTSVE
eukprot:gene14276-biopygen6483